MVLPHAVSAPGTLDLCRDMVQETLSGRREEKGLDMLNIWN